MCRVGQGCQPLLPSSDVMRPDIRDTDSPSRINNCGSKSNTITYIAGLSSVTIFYHVAAGIATPFFYKNGFLSVFRILSGLIFQHNSRNGQFRPLFAPRKPLLYALAKTAFCGRSRAAGRSRLLAYAQRTRVFLFLFPILFFIPLTFARFSPKIISLGIFPVFC